MTMRVQASLMVIMAVVMMGLASCDHYNCATGPTLGSSCTSTGSGLSSGSSGTGTGSPAAFVFFADDNNGDINAAELDTLGNFNEISGFVEPKFASSLDGGMVIVQKQWLYLALTSNQILGYSIGSSGALTAMTGSPYPTTNSFSITSDPAGKFLFVTGENGGGISVFQINQTDGSLTEVTGSPFPATGSTWAATTDGLGKFLYVSQGPLGDAVAAYSIGSAGALTLVPGSPFLFNMSQVKGEPSGKFLLGTTGLVGVNGEAIDNHLYVFAINQTTGAIAPVSGSPFATTYSPINIVVHPNGNLVYSFSENSSGVNGPMEGFQLSSTGTLTELTGSPFTAFADGIGMFDQSGAYLITHPVAGLTALSVNTSTGALASVATVSIGSNFGWAPTDPN